jgi:hypothetical protein
VDEVRMMIGNGVRKLVERAFAARDVTLKAMDARRDDRPHDGIYARCLTVGTTLMPGAEKLLTAYARAGVKIGVVTNKPEAFSRDDHRAFRAWRFGACDCRRRYRPGAQAGARHAAPCAGAARLSARIGR